MAAIRYIVADVDEAVAFYRDLLGFVLEQQFGPAVAIMAHGDLQLWLAGPTASASRPMPDGSAPTPGGWNRLVLVVDDIGAVVARLRAADVIFRNDIVTGPGGSQVLCEDPAGIQSSSSSRLNSCALQCPMARTPLATRPSLFAAP